MGYSAINTRAVTGSRRKKTASQPELEGNILSENWEGDYSQ